MSSYYPLGLTVKEVEILKTIFIYRGLRAKDVATFIHKTFNYSLSEEKSVFNYLNKLKKKALIKSNRLQDVQSLGSIYYLTNYGLEVMKEIFNIAVAQQGNGLLPLTETTTFWDIPSEYQQPPMKQTAHFLLTIDFFKKLVADQLKPFVHQTALYSNLFYYKGQLEQKVRPDATVYINDNLYAVEIDRATESHEQLSQKFMKYKEYHDFCQQIDDKTKAQTVHTILFVVESRTRRHGIQRRWTNVLSAFYKAFDNKIPDINLILVPLDEVAVTLKFETNRAKYLNLMLDKALTSYKENGFSNYGRIDDFRVIANHDHKQSSLVIIQLNLEFESKFYKDIYAAHEIINSARNRITRTNELATYQYLGPRIGRFCPFNEPNIAEGIDKTGLSVEFIGKLKAAASNVGKYQTIDFNQFFEVNNVG